MDFFFSSVRVTNQEIKRSYYCPIQEMGPPEENFDCTIENVRKAQKDWSMCSGCYKIQGEGCLAEDCCGVTLGQVGVDVFIQWALEQGQETNALNLLIQYPGNNMKTQSQVFLGVMELLVYKTKLMETVFTGYFKYSDYAQTERDYKNIDMRAYFMCIAKLIGNITIAENAQSISESCIKLVDAAMQGVDAIQQKDSALIHHAFENSVLSPECIGYTSLTDFQKYLLEEKGVLWPVRSYSVTRNKAQRCAHYYRLFNEILDKSARDRRFPNDAKLSWMRSMYSYSKMCREIYTDKQAELKHAKSKEASQTLAKMFGLYSKTDRALQCLSSCWGLSCWSMFFKQSKITEVEEHLLDDLDGSGHRMK